MKKWIVIIAVLGAGFAGYSVWNRQKAGEAVAQPRESEATAVAESRSINFVVKIAGDIGPDDMVSVRSEINGRLASLPVDIGDKVAKGALLCALDDRDLQTERGSVMTDIDGAKLQVAKARRNYERSKQLYADSLISQEVFQDAQTEFDLAQNALQRAEKALSQVDDKLLKTKIIAPFDCTVLTRPVSIGQAVSGSGGFNSGTEIMSVANLKEMIISAHVNQADVIRIEPSQKVDVEVEAVPGLKLNGTVERIAPQATLRNNIKGFATEIRLKDIDPRVRPGMTAIMTIPLNTAENVLAVPLAAVFTEKGERFVYVKAADGGFDMRPVRIGITDYQFAEVLSGLRDGDVVSLVRPENARTPDPGEQASLGPAGHLSTATNRPAVSAP